MQTIGKSNNCNLVIDNRDSSILKTGPKKGEDSLTTVSRLHAQLIKINGELAIVDAGSLNGTKVNGNDIGRTPRLLQDGDEVSLAAINLRFQKNMSLESEKTEAL